MLAEMLQKNWNEKRESYYPITPRESQLAIDVASGMANTAIANHRGIALRTVERHLGSIFWKMGLDWDHLGISRRVYLALEVQFLLGLLL